jgi:hypothetical protein
VGRRPRGDEDGAAHHGPQGRVVTNLRAEIGATVTSGTVLAEIKDAT